MLPVSRTLHCTAILLSLLAVAVRSTAAELDLARDSDPQLRLPSDKPERYVTFSPRLQSLWLEALARPEADLKRLAAEAIARAHRLGMKGLTETVPQLLEELENPNVHPVVRRAVALTLVALDARQTAPVLMKHALADTDMSRLLEPELARWNYQPMYRVWLARLEDRKTPRGPMLLALQASVTARVMDAVPHLRRLALDQNSGRDIRLEAARSLAGLTPNSQEDDARRLAGEGTGKVVDRLVAAIFLEHVQGAGAETLLLTMAVDPEPAVAAIAARRLLDIDPSKIKHLLDGLASHPDAGLRQLAARGLVELRTPQTVARLGPLLDDPHLALRVFVRESLVRLAGSAGVAEPVHRALMQSLATAGPRGRQQAVLAVGALRYTPAADRLLQLLEDESFEVAVPTAWALRRLAVPATAAPVLKRVQFGLEPPPRKGPPRPGDLSVRWQLPHLLELLGVLRYRPAAPLLKKFLPVPPPPMMRRGNPFFVDGFREPALWSLGHIYAGEADAELGSLFRERLINDIKPYKEGTPARLIAAINLGRMKSRDAVLTLRKFYEDKETTILIRRACAWAIEQITAARVPPPPFVVEPVAISPGNWFLTPWEPSR